MISISKNEADSVGRVIESGVLFRYDESNECEKFEKRYAARLGVEHVLMCSSGTAALTAALAGLGIGPGDEVIVPAHTFMATAVAVLAVGAIPVVVDIDESIMLDPEALKEAIGPCTRAVIPVHMWGHLCDMDMIMKIAAEHNLLVVEDACQCVLGSYNGKAAGAIGRAGAFSFNFYKNMTCGEGGAVVTNDAAAFSRMRCMIDPCGFFWEGREDSVQPFCFPGARASVFEGAILNEQLNRIPECIDELRNHKKKIIQAVSACGLKPVPNHSPEGECATSAMFDLGSKENADQFAEMTEGQRLSNTRRHTFTDWGPILAQQGAHHPALNPYTLPQNDKCRKEYGPDLCRRSLEILDRTVRVDLQHDATGSQVEAKIKQIIVAASASVAAGEDIH